MGKVPRVDVADFVYHAYNRGNAGGQLFLNEQDYVAFMHVVLEAQKRTSMRILAYCIMPNHWHFVLQPREDADMARFFHWLTVTHTRRWHAYRGSSGQGHIYQGKFKSNVCQEDAHLLRLIRYVERNALRANLVPTAGAWKWSSAWVREHGNESERKVLAEIPVPLPADYKSFLDEPQTQEELDAIRLSTRRGRPYGAGMWFDDTVNRFELGSTLRERGGQRRSQ